MGRKRGNFAHNYPKVIKYLNDNDIEYVEYNGGQHLRILGDVSLVDLWASRMKYHVVESEEAIDPTRYASLSYDFNEKELEKLLNGEIK